MLISIIVPVYNTAEWLSDSINSVIRQTYSNWELILVNDGSTDDSGLICQSFIEADSRIKLVDQPNQGVVAARYNGFLASIGDVILFLDSDDMFRMSTLSEIVRQMSGKQCELLRFGFDYCDINWNCTKVSLPPVSGMFNRATILGKKQIPLKEFSSPSIWDKAYTRSLAARVFEFSRDIQIRHSEDMLFSLSALVLSQRTAFIQQSLYMYLQRPGSAVHSLNINSVSDKQAYINGLVQLMALVPECFIERIEGLVRQEANESVSYVLKNGAKYSEGFFQLFKIIYSLKNSRFYQDYVLLNFGSPKYLVRDLLIYMSPIFAVLLQIKVRFTK